MALKKWEKLPDAMKCPEIRRYYEILNRRRGSLVLKRLFDITAALILLIVAAIPMLIIGLLIVLDSPGGVFYRQERVTTNGKVFRIHKFRTMVANADQVGTQVTVKNDSRITRVGAKIRKNRLDELPQLLDVLSGDMSFVGTRPEVLKYVDQYTDEMKATLLMPAGITSEASIRFKGEAKLLEGVDDVDRVYVEEILPRKMYHNLKSIENFSFWGDLRTMVRTVLAVLGKDYKDETADVQKVETR